MFFCLTFSLCFTINGQTEAEILDQANKFFKDEKFVDATPLYLRLLSLQPKNIDYNYRYGTCLLFNSNKKQESMRYLKFATESSNVDPQAHFYMGRSYHLNYLFNDAVRSYDKFASLAGQKAADKQDVKRLIEMCQDGRRLLMNYSEMVVYEKKEIESDKFFRLYDLKEIGGNLLVTADFQSKMDKKMGHTPLIYFPNSATEIFYSSYGESGENGKEIYRRVRKSSGGWGEPELIKGKVNTKFDEDFAYRSQDGQFLYFSSKGHNSMGGYDVFKSVYDKTTDSFLEPENMDFAVSSPDDDIFFLVDKNNQNGYFASARQSETGKLFVYKIRVEKLPTQLSIIAGVFESKIKADTKITVEVQDISTGLLLGKYTSKDDGKIIITFPSGGQYKYLMKLSGDPKVYSQNVNIPMKKNIKPLRQNLVHFMENGEEVVRVLDRFDEVVLEKDDILAALFSDKAQLNPNSQYFDVDNLNILSEQKKILEEIGAPNLNLSEVAAVLKENANSIKKVEDQSSLFEQKTTAQLELQMKNLVELDKRISKNAADYRSSAANSMARQDLLIESTKLIAERIETKDRIEDIIEINEKVQENLVFYQDLKNRSTEWKEKSAEITKLLSEDKNAEALQYIENNKVVIRSGMTDHVEGYQSKTSFEISNLNVEITELGRKKYNYETSSKDLQNNIDYLERSLYEGNSKDKEATKENIAAKRKDLNLILEEIVSIGNSIETKRTYKEGLVDELSEYLSLENSAKPKTIANYQSAKDKWSKLKNVPFTADYELLAEEIKKSENTDVAVNNNTSETKSQKEWLTEINPNYKSSIDEIQQNTSYSEAYKAELLIKAERENQTFIQSAIENNNKLLADNPSNNALLENQKTLKALEEVSNTDLANYNSAYELEKAKTTANALTEATIVQSVDKTYQEIHNYLKDDIVSDPLAKLSSLNDHDESFLRKVNDRLKIVNQELKTNPNQQEILNKEKELLTNLKVNKEGDIANRELKIQDIRNQLAMSNSDPTDKIDTTIENSNTNPINNQTSDLAFNKLSIEEQNAKMLTMVNPKYENKKKQIESSSIPNDEKIQQLADLNKSLLENIKTEKKKLSKKTQADELAALSRVEELTLNDNRQIELNVVTTYEEPSELISRLAVNYESQNESISQNGNLTPIEREQQKIAINTELINALKVEREKFEKMALANPSNEKVNSKIDDISRVEAEYAQLLASNERKLDDLKSDLALNSTNKTNPEPSRFSDLSAEQQEKKLLSELNPTYNSDKRVIENSSKTDKIKYSELLALETKVLNSLIDEKARLDKSTQQAEIDAILRIEKSINEQVSENQLNLVAAAETQDELITRLAKDYLNNKDQLAANSNLAEKEKAKRQLGVDQILVETLEKEKAKFMNLSKANPANQNLKEKVNSISAVITLKQNEMAQLSAVLNDNTASVITNSEVPKYNTSADLRKELLGEKDKSIMESNLEAISVEQLNTELSKLKGYESKLKRAQSELQASSNINNPTTKKELNLIGSELVEVEKKKRQYTITIGDLEREILAQNVAVENSKEDNTLSKIAEEEKVLMEKLDGDITKMKDIRKIEKQLLKLADQKVDRKNELLASESKEIQRDNVSKVAALTEIPTTSVTERVNKELAEKRVNQLTQESNQLIESAKKAKSNEEANQLMEKAVAKAKQASEILEIALVDNKVASLTDGKISTLSTRDELEQRKNFLLLEEAGINSEIKNTETEIKTINKPAQEEKLIAKRNQLNNERQMVVNQIAYIDKKISKIPTQPEPTITAEKKNTEISYKEEVEISSSLEYKEISKVTKEAMFLENEISFLLKGIDKDKQAAQKFVESAVVSGNKRENEKAEELVKEIQAKETRLTGLKSSLTVKQGEILDLFPKNPNQKAKIENLLIRGVEPIQTEVSNYIPIPEKGFEVDVAAAKTSNKELAVDTQVPTGLMFRVQVGAFSKPVAKDAFQEFNPVTGEKRSNGLTVYMAGFFDKSSSAADAQKTIRSLGYSDAFVVAYCDGERIPLVEGRRLETTKTCAPMQMSDLTITRTPTSKDTTKMITRELDYNKGIGAAPAFPVELKKGLFYTVQIGVYNRPVDTGTLKNITPLITKRLPNGQIRYSAGVYVSIEEAMPKRKEAIEKGIGDAYITAYYGSERISLEEAEKILRDRGVDVIEKTAIGIVKDVKQRIVAEEKLKEAIVEVERNRFEEGMGIQLVSKETFNEFPRDMLNRFNKHVSFYFDQNDKRLKSVIYSKIEDIPQIHFLREEVDTVFIVDYKRTLNQEKNGFKKIVFYVDNGQLEGDVADFIYRLNFRKEYIEQDEKMKVIIHNVPSNSIQFISDELRNLKMRSVVE